MLKKLRKSLRIFHKDNRGQAVTELLIFSVMFWLPAMLWIMQFAYVFYLQANVTMLSGYGASMYNIIGDKNDIEKKLQNAAKFVYPTLGSDICQISVGDDDSELKIDEIDQNQTYQTGEGDVTLQDHETFPDDSKEKPNSFMMPGLGITVSATVKPIGRFSKSGLSFIWQTKNVNGVNHSTRASVIPGLE